MLTHCDGSVYLWPGLIELRMPLYFVLSGMFFKTYGGLGDLGFRKINKLIVPFLFFCIIGYVYPYIYSFYEMTRGLTPGLYYHLSDNFTLDYDYWCKPNWPNNPVWFLLCLFWDNMVFYIIMKYCRAEWGRALAVILLGVAGYSLAYNEVRLPLFTDAAMSSMPFFYMGYLLKNSGILYPNNRRNSEFAIGVCLILAAMLVSYFNKSYYEFYINAVKGNILTVYVVSAAMVTGTLLLCKRIGRLPYVSYIGRYSVIVLGFHMCLIPVFTRVQHLFGMSSDILNFLLLLLVMPLVIKFSLRCLPRFTAQRDLFTGLPRLMSRSRA